MHLNLCKWIVVSCAIALHDAGITQGEEQRLTNYPWLRDTEIRQTKSVDSKLIISDQFTTFPVTTDGRFVRCGPFSIESACLRTIAAYMFAIGPGSISLTLVKSSNSSLTLTGSFGCPEAGNSVPYVGCGPFFVLFGKNAVRRIEATVFGSNSGLRNPPKPMIA
jgi:hypothetical protein